MKIDFKLLQDFINELRSTNSSNNKKEIFEKWKENKFITQALFYTYNPYYKYNVTSKTIEKYRLSNKKLDIDLVYEEFFQMLDDLVERRITGHSALQVIDQYIEFIGEEYRELIYLILDKDLKTRLSIGLINKVIPKFIPQFEVALALKEEEGNPDFDNEEWYASRKLDGVRNLSLTDKEKVSKFFSREGNEFTTLTLLEEQLSKTGLSNLAIDGELCLIDKDGNESFQGVMKEINKGSHSILDPVFLVFDLLSHEEFLAGYSPKKLSERHQELQELLRTHPELKNFRYVEQTLIKSKAHFEELREESIQKNWEGLIIRKNIPYEGCRSKNMLKIKLMDEAEFVVQGIEGSLIRFFELDPETNLRVEKTEMMLKNAKILWEGYTVNVGTGWSINERKKYYANPELLIGKEITVHYFRSTKNQEGGESLRFPAKKHVWENGRRNV